MKIIAMTIAVLTMIISIPVVIPITIVRKYVDYFKYYYAAIFQKRVLFNEIVRRYERRLNKIELGYYEIQEILNPAPPCPNNRNTGIND